MSKVTGPLFGTTAAGTIAGLGYFRQGRHGPEFVPLTDARGRKSQRQRAINSGFRIAQIEWLASPTQRVKIAGKWFTRYVTPWETYWNAWLDNHPEYRD